MRRVVAIARLSLLELFRDKGELAGVIILPLLLTWVFGTAFGSSGAQRALVVPVADLDGSRYSRQIVAELAASDFFDTQAAGERDVRALVRDGDAPVAVVVPKGFGAGVEAGRPVRLEVVRSPQSQSARSVAQIVEGAAARVSANAEAAAFGLESLAGADAAGPADGPAGEGAPAFSKLYDIADGLWEPEPPVAVTSEVVRASAAREQEMEAPANTQYSLGFTVFFVFMTALGSAGGVLEDRELGTLRRVLSSPVRRSEILAGKVLGVAAVSAFEAAMLVGFGAVVFGVPWGDDPLPVAMLLSGLVLSATGLGVMVSAVVRTRSQMSALGPVLSTGLAMLGGCYWPVEVASPFMQRIAQFTPTGWAMVGLKDVVARGAGLGAVWVPTGVLVAFAIVTIAVGVTRLKLE